MNAKSCLLLIVIAIVIFLFGKYCSSDFARIEREAIEYNRETERLGEETRAIRAEIDSINREIAKYEKREMDIWSGGTCDRVSRGYNCYGCFNNIELNPPKSRGLLSSQGKIDNSKGVYMRGGIFVILMELIKNTPTLVEFLIVSLVCFLITRLVKKSYVDLFNKEIVKGVKVKALIPIAITLIGCLWYCILAREKFFIALADGACLALMGIVYDNTWEAIKNFLKSIVGGLNAKGTNKRTDTLQ